MRFGGEGGCHAALAEQARIDPLLPGAGIPAPCRGPRSRMPQTLTFRTGLASATKSRFTVIACLARNSEFVLTGDKWGGYGQPGRLRLFS